MTGKVDVNAATAEELQTIPGIGPARALAMIAARPFKSVDDLGKVIGGLGKERVDALRNLFTVSTAKPRGTGVAELESEGTEDAALSQRNRRKAELIFKKNRDRLSAAERSELKHLQELSESRMHRDFPGPSLIDEKLRRIEERLRRDGADKA